MGATINTVIKYNMIVEKMAHANVFISKYPFQNIECFMIEYNQRKAVASEINKHELALHLLYQQINLSQKHY